MTQNEVDQLKHEKSVYNIRIRNLIGVFGMLLIFNIITFSPFVIASIVGLIVGLDNIPSEFYTTVLLLFLLNNFTNSVIQAYFRQDLRQGISKTLKMVSGCLTKSDFMHCLKVDNENSKMGSNKQTVPEVNVPVGERKMCDCAQMSQLHDHSNCDQNFKSNNSLSEQCPVQLSLDSMDTVATDNFE